VLNRAALLIDGDQSEIVVPLVAKTGEELGASLRRLEQAMQVPAKTGGAGRTRTADLEFRKLLLYPPELRPLGVSMIS
jgi:hypothetical protein